MGESAGPLRVFLVDDFSDLLSLFLELVESLISEDTLFQSRQDGIDLRLLISLWSRSFLSWALLWVLRLLS